VPISSYQFDYLIIIGMSLMDDWRAATQTDPKGDRILGGNQTPPPLLTTIKENKLISFLLSFEREIFCFSNIKIKNKKLVSAPSGSHSVTSCRRCVPK
jgi:hypothetical protein